LRDIVNQYKQNPNGLNDTLPSSVTEVEEDDSNTKEPNTGI